MYTLYTFFDFAANSVVAFDKKIGFLQSMGKPDPDPELQLFLRSISRFMELVGQSIYTVPTYKLWRTKLYTEFETAADNVYRYNVYHLLGLQKGL